MQTEDDEPPLVVAKDEEEANSFYTNEPASQLVKFCHRHSVEGLRCVDICCGNGASSIYLAQCGAALVVGLDKNTQAITEAKRRAAEAGVEQKCVFRVYDLLQKSNDCEEIDQEFDLVFDCRGFQVLCAHSEGAGTVVAQLCKVGGRFLTICGNAHELRSYPGGSSAMSVTELVGALSPPFSLASLAETRFDKSSKDETELPPLAWRAVFVKQQFSNESLSVTQFRGDSSTPRSFNSWNKKMYFDESLHSLAKPVSTTPSTNKKKTKINISNDGPPEIFARKLTTQLTDLNEDAVDAALSVDGSVVPSDCGSDYRGSDGFENIKLSREKAANEERARLAGDVPWVRFWEKRARAYQALASAQPVVCKLAQRVARMALFSSQPQYSLHAHDFWSAIEIDNDTNLFFLNTTNTTNTTNFEMNRKKIFYATDLAAGSGTCACALASLVYKGYNACIHLDLVEPAPSMAAMARAKASSLAKIGHPRSRATVWQIPVERCHERVTSTQARAQKNDIMTCSNAMNCLNYFDVLEAAAAMLRPGGALVFDLKADDYEETAEDAQDAADAWVPCVLAALKDRGVDATKDQVLSQQHQPSKIRPPLSASSVAAASAAAGLRLASVDLNKDIVPADYFIAERAISQSWLTEPFSDMPPHDAIQLRNVVVLDAANRAARVSAVLTTVIIVVVKPMSQAELISLNDTSSNNTNSVQTNSAKKKDNSLNNPRNDSTTSLDRGCRPMDDALKDDHFAASGSSVTIVKSAKPVIVFEHFTPSDKELQDEQSNQEEVTTPTPMLAVTAEEPTQTTSSIKKEANKETKNSSDNNEEVFF